MLYTAPSPSLRVNRRENRESSSASGIFKDISTAKAAGTKYPEISENGLRRSGVSRDATSDERLADLRPVVHTQLPERPLRDVQGCQRALRDVTTPGSCTQLCMFSAS